MARYPAEHKQATRARILAASDRLLKREGVAGASVDAVMRAAGLTVGGFYAHFASKEDLARQALLYSVEQSFARMTQGLERLDDRAFLRTLMFSAQVLLLEIPLGVARVLVADLAKDGGVVVHDTSGPDGPDATLMQRVLDGLRRL